MQPISSTRRTFITLFAVGAAALSLAGSAHAQAGSKPLGAVLTVPLPALGPIFAMNALQNNVNFLHLSQTAVGSFNTQIATVSISQRNNLTNRPGPLFCKLPKAWLPAIQQINNNTTIIDQTAVGNFNTQVADVQVSQENGVYFPGKTRFLCMPKSLLPQFKALNQQNFNEVHVSQLAIGDGNTQIALVAVDQSNAANLKFPLSGIGSLQQLNNNLTSVSQVAVGNGNTQVAQVDVSQSNDLAEQKTYIPGLTRFFLVPAGGVGTLKSANIQKNINQVDVIQTAVGDGNTQVALVSVDQSNARNLKVPGESLVNAMININTNVVVQTAVGNGNTQVATIGVSQQNAPAPTP